MTRPDHFGFNPQTAGTNPFQHTPESIHENGEEVRKAAIVESERMIEKLRQNDIEVLVLTSPDHITPDAIFLNNWFSHHEDGKLVFYPMLAPNRRLERQQAKLVDLLRTVGIIEPEIIDLTHDEDNGLILEATGSMVLDRVHKVAFAMASTRTIKEEFDKWCEMMGYEGVFINSTKHHKGEVYHTNLNMCVGSQFVVVCLEVIESEEEKEILRKKIKDLGKELIEISLDQVYKFCGNILELTTKKKRKIVVMSETARRAFTQAQKEQLEKYVEIVSFDISLIEEVGGGGVRCMIAEIFPPEH